MATMRNTAEIAEKILACIPEGQPEKEDLKTRFDSIERTVQVPNPMFAAPEIHETFLSRRFLAICKACQEVLGSPEGCDWKQAVVTVLKG